MSFTFALLHAFELVFEWQYIPFEQDKSQGHVRQQKLDTADVLSTANFYGVLRCGCWSKKLGLIYITVPFAVLIDEYIIVAS